MDHMKTGYKYANRVKLVGYGIQCYAFVVVVNMKLDTIRGYMVKELIRYLVPVNKWVAKSDLVSG
jgi:hypothetical protein